MLGNRRSELMLTGLLVWLIVSAGFFILLVLPYTVPQHQLAQFIPECEWQTQFQSIILTFRLLSLDCFSVSSPSSYRRTKNPVLLRVSFVV